MGYKTPKCPVAKRCGACEWLSVPYPWQLERKHDALVELFEPFDVDVEPVLGMEDATAYRAKIMSPFVRGRKGRPCFGMYERGTHRVIEACDCIVEHPAGRPILQSIAELAWNFHIHPYDEDTGRGLLRHAVVRISRSTGEAMVTLVVNSKEFPRKKAFVAALRERHPRIATVVFNVNTRNTNAVLGNKNMVAYGQGWLADELCGCSFRIPADAFYQTNPAQTEVLYGKAVEAAGLKEGELLLDAYCGIGTIGIIAAKRSKCALVGVESVPSAIEAARDNARINHVGNVHFECADAAEWLAKADIAPDVVIMDPPRAGSSEKFLDSLLAASPRRIVYVSCNPATQVRDLQRLSDAYRVRAVQPVDMFPHTEHVETVVSLQKAR